MEHIQGGNKVDIVPYFYHDYRRDTLYRLFGIYPLVRRQSEPFTDFPLPPVVSTSRGNNSPFYILFYGGPSNTREVLLRELKYELHRYTSVSQSKKQSVRELQLLTFYGMYINDYQIDYYILHSDVIINIHSYNDTSLEIHRINYLLSLHKIVISTYSDADCHIVERYKDGTIFVQDMMNVLYRLANDEEFYEISLDNVRMVHSIVLQNTSIQLSQAMDHLSSKLAKSIGECSL